MAGLKRKVEAKGAFPAAETALHAAFKRRRQDGRTVSERWLCVNARLKAKALAFKACHQWNERFSKR